MVVLLGKDLGTGGGSPLTAAEFNSAAAKAGYFLIIEDDYDGAGTYWSGAFKFAPGVEKIEDNEIYVIDYTLDKSVQNSKTEYNKYVSNVYELGTSGYSGSDTGSDTQYVVRTGNGQFGVAYRHKEVNLYVIAPVEYKSEIVSFFDTLGYKI